MKWYEILVIVAPCLIISVLLFCKIRQVRPRKKLNSPKDETKPNQSESEVKKEEKKDKTSDMVEYHNDNYLKETVDPAPIIEEKTEPKILIDIGDKIIVVDEDSEFYGDNIEDDNDIDDLDLSGSYQEKQELKIFRDVNENLEEISSELYDPNELKKAIIINEILKNKID